VITAVKAISYRVIVSISHIFVDYYWTGNYVAAGALEVLQITINSTKFYFHELAWAKYMGVPRGDSARTLDFKYIAAMCDGSASRPIVAEVIVAIARRGT